MGYDIGLYNACEDIKFLELLKAKYFKSCTAIIWIS